MQQGPSKPTHRSMTKRAHPPLFFIGLLIGLGFLAACSRPDVPSDGAQPSQKQSEVTTRSQSSLHEDYPTTNLGDVCAQDKSCDSPLRCMRGECRFPAGLTGEEQDAPVTIDIHGHIGTVRYRAERADTPYERKMGLMNRRHLQEGFGMLFVFEEPEMQAFWMKNTLIPLDMLFITEDQQIDSIIEQAAPKTLTPRRSVGKVPYVLEINGGDVARWGIQKGDRVTITPRMDDERP